ncbi:hypothetical protein DFJ74DRAFT_682595 [Hyaloraphidium curvatum]|nr:hypothetical protein DFJ74DRAFT_682595 [Hyaloraphidium curvatum]
MVAIKNFVASRPDEIPLTVGDILAVRSLFDDGWAFGTDHSLDAAANNNGYFPIAAAKTLTGEAMASYLSNGPPTEPAAAEAMAASGPNPPTTAPAATAPAPTAPAETEPAVQQ